MSFLKNEKNYENERKEQFQKNFKLQVVNTGNAFVYTTIRENIFKREFESSRERVSQSIG
jgi:hypothetical protein